LYILVQEIETMLAGEARYNPEKSLSALEAYAQQQVKDGSYDLDANLALLKVPPIAPGPARPQL
jgi:hypothetical protein